MTYQDIVNIIRDAANYVNPDGFFIHGRKTDGSLQYNESFPQIILLEPTPNTSINNNSFVETISFPIIFVAQDTSESTELRREDLKQEMYLLSRKLLSKIDENELLQNVSYAGGQPEIRQMSGTATGFSYTLEITYPLSECTLDFDLPPTIQLFATQTTVAAGTTVQIGWIANNVNSVTITPFGVLQGQFGFVNTVVNSTTTYTGTATNSAGTATDTITITVGNGCDDATAVLKNTDGTILSTTDIPSGDTQDIIAPDAGVKNSDASYNTQVSSNGSLILPDITVTDSDGSTFTQPSVTNVTCTPQVKTVFIKGIFGAGNDTMEQLTIDADNEGTYTVITDDGASGVISLEVNGAPTSVPFSLLIGDTLDAVRTVDTNIGFFKISGTYV